MNRIDKAIVERLRKGNLPTAYDGWDKADREICGTLNTKGFDYTRRGGIVIFERYKEENMGMLRIRKLTESECMRFMGFEEKDYLACVEAGLSRANVYHQAGDSIVTTCLVGIFGSLLGIEPKPIIEEYAQRLSDEVKETIANVK